MRGSEVSAPHLALIVGNGVLGHGGDKLLLLLLLGGGCRGRRCLSSLLRLGLKRAVAAEPTTCTLSLERCTVHTSHSHTARGSSLGVGGGDGGAEAANRVWGCTVHTSSNTSGERGGAVASRGRVTGCRGSVDVHGVAARTPLKARPVFEMGVEGGE